MHCVSRVVDRQFLLGDEERDTFIQMMRMYEKFCGIRILSYCVMSNHFHILLEIPPRIEAVELGDEEFLAKLAAIYSDRYVQEIRMLMKKLNKNQAPKAMRELKEKYTYRMGDMSQFMKSLKQRFTQWYNKKHGRRGTLWEERFSATAVSAGRTARMVAAYIDLNPMRAGIVKDPMDYRWCGYAEAVGGDPLAISAYSHLHEMVERKGVAVSKVSDEEVMQEYRILMAEEGQESDPDALPMTQGQRASKTFKRRRGYSREEIDAIIEQNGKLSKSQLLRCKTRYFSNGAVIGSKVFVDGFLKNLKSGSNPDRKMAAKPMRRIKWNGKVADGKIFSYRDLQKDVYGSEI